MKMLSKDELDAVVNRACVRGAWEEIEPVIAQAALAAKLAAEYAGLSTAAQRVRDSQRAPTHEVEGEAVYIVDGDSMFLLEAALSSPSPLVAAYQAAWDMSQALVALNPEAFSARYADAAPGSWQARYNLCGAAFDNLRTALAKCGEGAR